MPSKSRAVQTLVVVGALVVPLTVVSIAFACARLATLKLNRSTATEGATVTAVGRNFNNDAKSSPVALRFNSRTGPVLWEGRPNRQGKFVASFRAPKAMNGHYVILATQQTAEGRPAAGTPGRAPLRMGKRSRASRRSTSAPPVVLAAGPGSGGGPPAMVLAAPLALLFAGGAGALALARRRSSPASAAR